MTSPALPARRALALLTVLLLGGCASGASGPAPPAPPSRLPGDAAPRNGIVLRVGDAQGRTGNVLDALQGRISGMEVHRSGGCPEVVMRGRKSITASNNPVVYMDGARLSDTCILESMLLVDLDRIEVYPMGVTTRPGYRNSPNGLILLFTLRQAAG